MSSRGRGGARRRRGGETAAAWRRGASRPLFPAVAAAVAAVAGILWSARVRCKLAFGQSALASAAILALAATAKPEGRARPGTHHPTPPTTSPAARDHGGREAGVPLAPPV